MKLRARVSAAHAIHRLASVGSQWSRIIRIDSQAENIAGFDFFWVFEPAQDWRGDTNNFAL